MFPDSIVHFIWFVSFISNDSTLFSFAVLDVQISKCNQQQQHRNNTNPSNIHIGPKFFCIRAKHIVPNIERVLRPQNFVECSHGWLVIDCACLFHWQYGSDQSEYRPVASWIFQYYNLFRRGNEHSNCNSFRRFVWDLRTIFVWIRNSCCIGSGFGR